MPNTIGYHYVKSTYGQWLPGDDRGHWSNLWDEQIGYTQPHQLHEGDPIRKRMAEERMKHDPVRLSQDMIAAALEAVASCIEKSDGGLAVSAAAIEPTHIHLLIPYSGRDIHKTVKWIADQMTKAHSQDDGPQNSRLVQGQVVLVRVRTSPLGQCEGLYRTAQLASGEDTEAL